MAGKGWTGTTYSPVGDVQATHQYDVTVEFQIAFDWGGWNSEGAYYEIWCDGQMQSGWTTFSVSSGGGSWVWTTIGTKTFRITMDQSGAAKNVNVGANINTGANPSRIDTGTVFGCTLPAVTWQWTVNYNANGGSGAPLSQTKTYGDTLKLSTTKPTRTGYIFQGWATSSGGGVAYASGANYTANSGITLYAVWKKITYSVKYDANGGTGAPAAQTKSYGDTLKLSTTKPTRNLYNFLGWGTSAASTTVAYAPGANYTKNEAVTLYAIWELAWVAPRITDIVLERCDSSGVSSETGTYYKISLAWATDRANPTVKVECKESTITTWTADYNAAKTGTNGTHSGTYGSGGLDVEKTYDIRITVTDSVGSTVITRQIAPMSFTIDFKAGGKGVAFGKPASVDNVIDSSWNFRAPNFQYLIDGRARNPITMVAGNQNGDGIQMGTGGFFIAGSGESASNYATAVGWGGDIEKTAITADNDIRLATNCQTIGNRNEFIFNSNGSTDFAPSIKNKAAIADRTDLNNMKTPGTYACLDAIAVTLKNCPIGIGFTMIVEHTYGSTSYISQTIIETYTASIYQRRYTASTNAWSTWKRLLNDSDIIVGSTHTTDSWGQDWRWRYIKFPSIKHCILTGCGAVTTAMTTQYGYGYYSNGEQCVYPFPMKDWLIQTMSADWQGGLISVKTLGETSTGTGFYCWNTLDQGALGHYIIIYVIGEYA